MTPGSGSSRCSSVFLIVNAIFGTGLLNFPSAYHHAGGIVAGNAIHTVLTILVAGSMIVLIYCAKVRGATSYSDVVLLICGKGIHILTTVLIIVYIFGTSVTILVVIGDQCDKFFAFAYGLDFEDYWYMNRKFTTSLLAVVLILPMCIPQRIDVLKYVSAVAGISVLYCVILVVVKYFTGVDEHLQGPVQTSPDNFMEVFAAVPTVCFGYQCHLGLVLIYACAKETSIADFSITISIALTISYLLYTATGTFGYLTFGSSIQADFLLSYAPTPDVIVAIFLTALKMVITYPVQLYVIRETLDGLWIDMRHLSTTEIVEWELCRRLIITFVFFSLTLLPAVFISNISIVINFLGGIAAIFIFVFPGLCVMQLLLQGNFDPISWANYIVFLILAIITIVFGVFLFGVVTAQSVIDDFNILFQLWLDRPT